MLITNRLYFCLLLLAFYCSLPTTDSNPAPNRLKPHFLPSHHFNHRAAHQLTLDSNSAELIINDTKILQLLLQPLPVQPKRILVKFNCDPADAQEVDWESSESHCTILELAEGYDFPFDYQSDSALNLSLHALKPGKQQLVAHAKFDGGDTSDIDASKAYITVNIGRSTAILTISVVVGWIYFAAWSISFWPQIWQNFKRRSVVGLNFDYVALNITGFLSYSAYNISIKYIPVVEDAFFEKNPRSQNPIEVNDVVFGVHAVFATIIVIIQCFIYERGNQTVSWLARIFLILVWAAYIIIAFIVGFSDAISLLDYIYIFSYVKLAITIIKYIPQAWYNFRRKSTVGWSIENIILDCTGGTLSMFQMFLLAHNYDDWYTIMNNFTKFGMGLISILFDILFLVQHYILYRNPPEENQKMQIDSFEKMFSDKVSSIVNFVKRK